MLMLSEIRRFRIFENEKYLSRVVDLVIDLAAGDYPPVTEILLLLD